MTVATLATTPNIYAIPEDDFLLEEDSVFRGEFDDERANLLTTPSQSSSPVKETSTEPDQPMDTEGDTAQKLLSLRKNYKKTTVALTKAKAHRGFIKTCRGKQQTPKGLKVHLKCSAFLADFTNISAQFDDTSKKAEAAYLSNLDAHYEKVVNQLAQKQTLLEETMTTLTGHASDQEKDSHQEMLEKTNNNVQKLSDELDKKKKRKLENIAQPSKRNKTDKSTLGRPRKQSTTTGQTNHKDGASPTMVSDRIWPPQSPPPRPLFSQQPLLSMTLADLLVGLQGQATLQPHTALCTPVSGQPPMLLRPGGKDGMGQPPQLPQTVQQQLQLQPSSVQLMHLQPQPTYCTPGSGQPPQLYHPGGKVGLGRPPQLPQPIQQVFGGQGRLSYQQPQLNMNI